MPKQQTVTISARRDRGDGSWIISATVPGQKLDSSLRRSAPARYIRGGAITEAGRDSYMNELKDEYTNQGYLVKKVVHV